MQISQFVVSRCVLGAYVYGAKACMHARTHTRTYCAYEVLWFSFVSNYHLPGPSVLLCFFMCFKNANHFTKTGNLHSVVLIIPLEVPHWIPLH